MVKKEIDNEKEIIWEEKEGILYLNMGELKEETSIENLILETKKILEKSQGGARILVNLTPYLEKPRLRSSQFRKELAQKARDILNNPGFKKAAIFGGTNIVSTIASFITTAAGLKNVKIFENRGKALKWLKEE